MVLLLGTGESVPIIIGPEIIEFGVFHVTVTQGDINAVWKNGVGRDVYWNSIS